MTSPNRSVSDFIHVFPHIHVLYPQILHYIVHPGLSLSSSASCSLHMSIQSRSWKPFVVHSRHMPEPSEPSFPNLIHHCLPLSQLLSGNLISHVIHLCSLFFHMQNPHARSNTSCCLVD